MQKKSKKRIAFSIIGIAAASLIVSGMTVSALGYGPLADDFRRLFGIDDTTAEIIDQGHYSEIGQEQTDGVFTVKLVSVTGDKASPKLLFDVTVNDEQLAASNDRLQLSAYILDEDSYQNHLDEYGTWDATGERDPEVRNLYHVFMDGPSAFMAYEDQVIAAIRQIRFENDPEHHTFDYDVNLEYRFVVPGDALKASYMKYFDGITVSSENVDYDLIYATYGAYDASFTFNFDFRDNPLADGNTNYMAVEEEFDLDFLCLSKDFILTVDGVEYTRQECGSSYYIPEEQRCSIWMSFPGFNYAEAEHITLTSGGKTYTLKDGKDEIFNDDNTFMLDDNDEIIENGDTISMDGFLHTDQFTDITLNSGQIDYKLDLVYYDEKETTFMFLFDFIGSPLADGETDYHNYDAVCRAFDEDWAAYAGRFVLTVDGTEYAPTLVGCSYCYQEDEYLEPGKCTTSVYFPVIDYPNVASITLTVDGVSCTLKG